jgi:hypothetical protein
MQPEITNPSQGTIMFSDPVKLGTHFILGMFICKYIYQSIHVSGDYVPIIGGTRWRGWLRHCAKNQKVAGLIPDGVIGIFH